MKRSVSVLLVGLAVTTVVEVSGQDGFLFNNYAAPYVPIVYDTPVSGVGGNNVGVGDGVQIELWWGAGAGLGEEELVFGQNALWSDYDGFTLPWQAFLNRWYRGVGTVQLRASGTVGPAGGLPVDTVRSRGPLVETPYLDAADYKALPPFIYTPGFTVFVVPEPSSLSVLGLGTLSMLLLKRRTLHGNHQYIPA